MLFFLLIAVIILLFFVYNAKNEKPKNFPAGPRSFPIIGSLLSVGVDLKSAFQKWRSQWGDIVGFKMGGELAIVISDFEMLQEAFKDDRFSGRPGPRTCRPSSRLSLRETHGRRPAVESCSAQASIGRSRGGSQ